MDRPRERYDVRRDWPFPVALYALALALRLYLLPSAVYGDEGFHYHISRTWGAPTAGVHLLDLDTTGSDRVLFWWRPAFMSLLTPAALVSFDAYRALFSAYTALLAPLVFVLLRELWVKRSYAVGAGLAIAASPYFTAWGERVFPDALMATLFVAGVWFWVRRQPVPTAAFLLLAVWTKESAIVGVGALTVYQWITDWARGALRLYPLRITRMSLALAAVCAFGLVPLTIALRLGLNFPGWTDGSLQPATVELLFGSIWLLPIILIGLLWQRTRWTSLAALVYPTFYIAYNVLRGRNVEVWYHALPQFLALVATVHTLDEARVRSFAKTRLPKALPKLATVLVALVFTLGAVLPSGTAAKEPLAPISSRPGPSLAESMTFERTRDRSLPDVLASVQPADWDSVFAFDVGWFFIWYPFSYNANVTRWAFSVWAPPDGSDLHRWVNTAENLTKVTVLYKVETPLNLAFRDTYGDCVEYENADYMIIRASDCAGRGVLLAENLQSRVSMTT